MLGKSYAMSGNFKDAVAPFKKATKFDPDFLQAYVNLAYAYVVENRDRDAMKTFEKAINLLI